MKATCQNCGDQLEERFAYCPGCGQQSSVHRLRMREILNDAWAKFTDIDQGFFTLLRDLVIRPGTIAREYIAGKRKKHFAPLNFYLIVGTLMILTINATGWLHDMPDNDNHVLNTSGTSANSPNISKSESDRQQSLDSTALYPATKPLILSRRATVDNFWAKYSDLVAIAAAPILCTLFWLFYRRIGFNYTEMLVACLYMIGFTNLVYAVIFFPLSAIFTPANGPTYVMAGVFKIFEICYFSYYFFNFTRDKVDKPLLRASVVSFCVALFWSALSISLIAVYMTTGFGLD